MYRMLALAGVVACAPSEPPDPSAVDQRIDAAPQTSDPDSHSPRLCTVGGTTVVAAWIDDRDGSDAVWVNRSVDGGASWMPAAVRVSDTDRPAANPSLSCTGGAAWLAWDEPRGDLDNRAVVVSGSLDGGATWTNPVAVDADPDDATMSLGPSAVATRDAITVAWFDSLHGAYDILLSRSEDDGETWTEPERMDRDSDPGRTYSGAVRATATSLGVVAVWQDAADAGITDIHAARYDAASGRVRGQQRLDTGEARGEASVSLEPVLGADGDHVVAAWPDQRFGPGRDILVSTSTDGGSSWSDPPAQAESDRPGWFEGLDPEVCVSGDRAWVAWRDARDGAYDVYVRTFARGVAVGEDQRLDRGSQAGYAHSTDVRVVCGGGAVAVVWADERGEAGALNADGFTDLYYNVDRGAGFLDDDLRIDHLPAGVSYKLDPQVALLGDTLVVAWIDGRLGTSDVFFTTMPLGEEAEPPEPAEG